MAIDSVSVALGLFNKPEPKEVTFPQVCYFEICQADKTGGKCTSHRREVRDADELVALQAEVRQKSPLVMMDCHGERR